MQLAYFVTAFRFAKAAWTYTKG